MTTDLLTLVFGLALLLGGGEAIVRGAAGLSTILGVPRLLVGLTLVAFGTSAPELTVNLLAALRGSTGLSFGNIVGSNLANVGLVIGLAGIMRPLFIQRVVVWREIPIMLLVTGVTIALVADYSRGAAVDRLDRTDGVVLLILFALYGYVVALDWTRGSNDASQSAESDSDLFDGSPLRCIGLVLVGLVVLVAGGELSVTSATSIAVAMQVPEAWIGLTIVAIGTSLPELATAVVATLRNEVDLAVGNVVGSNIFNLALVGGATSVVTSIDVPPGGFYDLAATATLSTLLLLVSFTQRRTIIRAEAGILLLLYAGYILWRSSTLGA